MKTINTGLLIILLIAVFNSGVYAGDVRNPVFAGKFYPKEEQKLKKVIEKLRGNVDQGILNPFSGKKLKAMIMPHAGYIYSGQTASYGTFLIDGMSFDKVVMIGPDHTTGFSGSVVNCAASWRTPMGKTDVHGDAKRLADKFSSFTPEFDSFLNEHSLEVILPFLQYSLKKFSILPVVAGRADIYKTAKAIDGIVDNETLIVASSDLSHYLSYSDAKKKDAETINYILNSDVEKLLGNSNTACGRVPAGILITIAKKRGWEPFLVHYSNSGDTAGDKNRVVGYCTIAFFEKAESKVKGEFSKREGDALVKLAGFTIANALGIEIDNEEKTRLDSELENNSFNRERGTFVTLYKNKRLRGCIGNLSPDTSVKNGVAENALNAAFRDPRFPKLTKKEFKDIDIEVSILTTPEELDYSDEDDLLDKLRPGIDGVIIRKGYKRATYLPQVWDQLPDPADFLYHLCSKAGLAGNEWKKGKVTIMTYQAQYFE